MKLLILIALVYLAYRVGTRWLKRTLQMPREDRSADAYIDDVMVRDPVCGIHFPRREGVELQHGGKTYLFCSTACRDRFLKQQEEKAD
ncbi:conserved hypothetical protein [Desulfosarcina cetonica]|uniref:YHS domain-containing protein n=1 Tax=Desulfosarcina cetonica TaxID=90730 RepID=UPI0006D2C3BE|nr:YHS domain-containing protein [Desulfosarcina cetonica]VTR68235.1 conserved hypothetical protein [Desulfosarcina cetonica]